MSERVERKIVALLDEVAVSPYGNPVPGLDELGLDAPEVEGLPSLVDHLEAERFVVERLGEPLQVDHDLLEALFTAGVQPGAAVTTTVDDDMVEVTGPGGAVHLTRAQAGYIFGRLP